MKILLFLGLALTINALTESLILGLAVIPLSLSNDDIARWVLLASFCITLIVLNVILLTVYIRELTLKPESRNMTKVLKFIFCYLLIYIPIFSVGFFGETKSIDFIHPEKVDDYDYIFELIRRLKWHSIGAIVGALLFVFLGVCLTNGRCPPPPSDPKPENPVPSKPKPTPPPPSPPPKK